jgi:hypothetical protein
VPQDAPDPYAYAKSVGIYQELSIPDNMTTADIVDRIVANR